jgi:TolA-binding protein
MSDTPTPGETVVQGEPKNDATNQSTPPPAVKAEDNAAVEQLKKELAQAQMRANQLENERKKLDEAEQRKKEKELEEQNQFKTLYEQEAAKRKELEEAQEQEKRQKEVAEKKSEVFADYSDEVRVLAEEAGMSLTDTDEEAVQAFKEKLDKIKALVPGPKVSSNNPNPVANEKSYTQEEMQSALRDPKAFHEFVTSKFPGIAAMTRQQPPR